MILGLAALGGLAAATGGAAPTGIVVVDAIYVGGLGAGLVVGAARSRRFTWLIAALVLLWSVPDLSLRLVAAVAVLLSLHALATGRQRWVGAVIGVGLAAGFARLGGGPFHGASTLLAAAAVAPLAASALRRLPAETISRLGAAVGSALAAAVLATLGFALIGVWALGDVTTAIDASTDGFERAADGDQEAAVASLTQAEAGFDEARRKVGGVWAMPARLVPVVGQHVRAVQVATSEGVSLAGAAADAASAIDLDDVRVQSGRLDLTLLDDLAPVLSRAETAIERADQRLTDVQSPWLLEPVADRLDTLSTELRDALPAAQTASAAAQELPAMLGRGGAVHWLVLTTTPAEARGLGGLVGNYLVVEAFEGRIEIVAAGRNEDLNRALVAVDAVLGGSDQYRRRWGPNQPERFFQDVGLEPDLPSVGAVAADLYEQATGLSIEGVVTIDPYAIAAILDVTGPVSVDGIRLDESSVADFLLVEQYERFDDDEPARVQALSELVTAAFDAFTSGELPGPRALATTIGPVVEEDRLAAWWKPGADAAALLRVTGLDGSFPPPNGHDLLGIVHQNAGQNKIDAYLERSLTYEITVDERGNATATAVARFRNTAPATGLPDAVIGSNDQGYPLGTNVALVHLHTALDLVSVAIDGMPTPASRQLAFGAEAIGLEIEIPAGATVEIVYDLAGRVDPDYHLQLVQQPLVGVETVSVTATVDGSTRALLVDAPLRTDQVVAFASSS